MQLACLLELHAAVEGGKVSGCRYDFGRVFLPRFLPGCAFRARALTGGGVGMGDWAGLLAESWGNMRGRPMEGRAGSPKLRLQEGLVERGGNFGRITDDVLLRKRLKGRATAALLLDWLALLLVVSGVFTGLGLVGMAEIEPRRLAYEQGRATRVAEQREASFRRRCLVLREASSRVDSKAVAAAVRLPLQPPGAPAGLPVDWEVSVAQAISPGPAAHAPRARSWSLPVGPQPDIGRPVQTARIRARTDRPATRIRRRSPGWHGLHSRALYCQHRRITVLRAVQYRRLAGLISVLLMGFVCLEWRLYSLQVVRHGELEGKARSYFEFKKNTPPIRGEIRDVNGCPLAMIRPGEEHFR